MTAFSIVLLNEIDLVGEREKGDEDGRETELFIKYYRRERVNAR